MASARGSLQSGPSAALRTRLDLRLASLKAQDTADLGGNVRGRHHVADDRDGISARIEEFRYTILGNPADRDDWNLDRGAHFAKALHTLAESHVLGAAGIHRAKADICRAAIFGGSGLVDAGGRHADYSFLAEQ